MCLYMTAWIVFTRACCNFLVGRALQKRILLKNKNFTGKKETLPGQLLWTLLAISVQNVFCEKSRILKLRNLAFRLPVNICTLW